MKKYLALSGLIVAAVVCATVWLSAAPSIGAVAANPAYVVINTPTAVLFTAHINDPSVIPTGVNLLKVDANGKTLAVIGPLRDDGSNGDALAGDKILSLRLSLNAPALGHLYYRVSATFRGVLQRVQSPVIRVTVDPVPLPPDPGEPGKQTLAGIDSDADGTRDDLQRYIALSYIDSPSTQQALTQFAREAQELLLASATPTASIQNNRNVLAAMDCLYSIRPDDANLIRRELEAQMLNTPERARAFIEASGHFAGHSYRLTPRGERSSKCSF